MLSFWSVSLTFISSKWLLRIRHTNTAQNVYSQPHGGHTLTLHISRTITNKWQYTPNRICLINHRATKLAPQYQPIPTLLRFQGSMVLTAPITRILSAYWNHEWKSTKAAIGFSPSLSLYLENISSGYKHKSYLMSISMSNSPWAPVISYCTH